MQSSVYSIIFLLTVLITLILECILGYDFDAYTHTCIKVYDLSITWSDARTHCQDDGGDIITMPTLEKWQFVHRYIECEYN